MSGGLPVHFSGMTAEMSPPRVAIALEEVNLLQIFKQVKGEHSLTTILEEEYRQYLISHVFDVDTMKKIGELELMSGDPGTSSALSIHVTDLAHKAGVYASAVAMNQFKSALIDMQPIIMENLSTMLSENTTKVDASTPAEHMLTLEKVVTELASFAADLDTTKDTESSLSAKKKLITSELRQSWSVTENPEPGAEPSEGDDSIAKQAELEAVNKKISTLAAYSKSVRESIKSVLSDNYGTSEMDWNSESKTVRAIRLDSKLAGTADPTLAENLIVNVRTFLHAHVSKFWAIIPYLECMDADRSDPDHWKYPCEANNYSLVPSALLETYKSQSSNLFQHIWTTMSGSTQVGSTILRKTFAEKFLGDVLNDDVSVKSTKNDGMMSIYWLLTVHESAGYVEKTKLKSTLHQACNMFLSGNPQSKMEAIRFVIDKAVALKVNIDFEATIKPTVMNLRKRSPNFNELAAKYLKPHAFPDWRDQGLHILDTLLSEIDHVVDTLGMQGNMQDLQDIKSKSNEAGAKAAFAYYTGGDGTPKTSGNTDIKNGARCGALGCTNKVAPQVTAKQAKLRADNPDRKYAPPICSECMGKLKAGTVDVIKCTGNMERTLFVPNPNKANAKAAKKAAKKSNADTKSSGSDQMSQLDMKSALRELMRETFMEMRSEGNADNAGANLQIEDKTPEPEPESSTNKASAGFVKTLLETGRQ